MSVAIKRLVTKRVILATFFGTTLVYLIYFACINGQFVKLFGHNNTENTKYVLYWSPFWYRWDYFIGYGFEPFKSCEYKNCFATKDRHLIPLEQFNALLFHAQTYHKNDHGIPWVRSPHQIYIFVNIEAPVYICPDLKQYNSYFNWTMSYRFDSDIVRRHGYIIKEKTNYTMPSKEALNNKTRLAAWFVSHCSTSSYREDLGAELQKFMSLDVYGDCGTLKCPRKKGNGKISSSECYDMAEKMYKFYLSFENSYCKDYSSEKLYSILKKDLVPVVYSADNYGVSAPPNSVINVEDFKSAQELAEYLKYLDGNEEEYLKFFEWKKEYGVTTTSWKSSPCQICKKLHEPIKQSIYNDLHEWWWGKNRSMCKLKKALPKIVSDLL